MSRKLKKKVKIGLYILIAFLILVIVLLCLKLNGSQEKEVVETKEKVITTIPTTTKPKDSNKLSMVLAGDCLIHRFVYTDASNGDGTYSFSKMFTEIEDIIKDKDIAYYNQESNIGGKALGLSAYPLFNSPEEIGDDMVKLGFNMVSLANNHTLDKGEKGVVNSVDFWKTKPGVYYSGQALSWEERESNIKVLEKNGIKYAFFSYTTVTNGLNPPVGKEYLTNIYSEAKVKEDLAKVKDKVDFIIVAMHWGEEYTTYPSIGQKAIAQFLAKEGVNLVIGNHAHSIQPVEMIGDTLVFYALGNFISAQDTPDRLTGTIVTLNANKTEEGKIVFTDVKADLIYTYFRGSSNFKIYPYTKLNNSLLYNYETYYNKYKSVLTRYTDIIEVK